MTSFAYMLTALFAMIPAPFVFKTPMRVPFRAVLLSSCLLFDEFLVYLVSSPVYPHYEYLPFQMLALTLCYSTLFLEKKRRLFASLATVLWIWIDFFGELSLSYRGIDFLWIPFAVLPLAFFPIYLMNPYKKETRFLLAVIWATAWTLSYAWTP